MAQNKYALARYGLINSLLTKYEYVKTGMIVEHCRRELRCSISQRSIQMDIYAMKNDSFLGYFAPIEYCKRRKAYFYTNRNYRFCHLYFSKQEISLMENAVVSIRNKGLKEEWDILYVIQNKIKLFFT